MARILNNSVVARFKAAQPHIRHDFTPEVFNSEWVYPWKKAMGGTGERRQSRLSLLGLNVTFQVAFAVKLREAFQNKATSGLRA